MPDQGGRRRWSEAMNEVLRDVLPIALGIALSPFPIIPMLLILTGERPRSAGGAFLAAFTAGIAASTIALSLVADVLDTSADPAPWTGWVRVALGLALVGLAIRASLGRGAEAETPAWISTAATATPSAAAKLGLLLVVANPKVVVLAAAAGSIIGSGDLPPGRWLAAVATFTALSSLGVALPYLARVFGGQPVAATLGRARDWLVTHNKAVSAVVLAIIGLVVLTNGVEVLRA